MALGLLIPSHNLRYLSFVLNGAFHLNASRVFFCCMCSDKTFEEVSAGHLFCQCGHRLSSAQIFELALSKNW